MRECDERGGDDSMCVMRRNYDQLRPEVIVGVW